VENQATDLAFRIVQTKRADEKCASVEVCNHRHPWGEDSRHDWVKAGDRGAV